MELVASKNYSVGGNYTRKYLNLKNAHEWTSKSDKLMSSTRRDTVLYKHGGQIVKLQVKFKEEEKNGKHEVKEVKLKGKVAFATGAISSANFKDKIGKKTPSVTE